MAATAEKWIRTVAAEALLGGGGGGGGGYIYKGFRLPGQIWVVLPVGVISITILGIIWWPILAHNTCTFNH